MRRVVRRMQPTGTNMWMYYDNNEPHSRVGFDAVAEAIAHAVTQYGPEVHAVQKRVWNDRHGEVESVYTLWASEDEWLQDDGEELAVATIKCDGTTCLHCGRMGSLPTMRVIRRIPENRRRATILWPERHIYVDGAHYYYMHAECAQVVVASSGGWAEDITEDQQ
jgi:hypothetical protein